MSVPKTTKEGWPDPTEWINRLYQAMAMRQANYDAETDVLLKRNKAGGMLAEVLHALMELPAFRDDSVHLPLKDLLIFIADLDQGRDHPWTAPVNVGGTNITPIAKRELKVWIRAVYGVLTDSGLTPVQAHRRIADGLKKSGRSGKNGRPVSFKRIGVWCREAENPHEQQIREKVKRWWAEFRADTAQIRIVDSSGKPAAEAEIAGVFADRCWSLPQLRDRSVSGGSE